jgi:hypothetical protein
MQAGLNRLGQPVGASSSACPEGGFAGPASIFTCRFFRERQSVIQRLFRDNNKQNAE